MTKLTATRFQHSAFQRCIIRIAFILFPLTVSAATGNPIPDNAFKNDYLLVINTYVSDAPWSCAIIEPVQHWLAADNQTSVYVEHLNMLIVDDTVKFHALETNIFNRYAKRAPKAILLLGNPAIMIKDDIRAHWGDVPIVFCPEEDYMGPDEAYIAKKAIPEGERIPLAKIAQKDNMTVLQSKLFLKENIDLLGHMIPGLKKVLLVGDGRHINQQLDSDMKVLLAKSYPGMGYEFLSAADMSLEELLDRLCKIDPQTTGVLFSSWFSKTNYSGSTVLTTNSFRMIANIPIPVFALKSAVMDNSGIVGGYFYDNQAFLNRLQQVLRQVLGGTPARDIPFYIPTEAIPTFNYPSLLLKGFSVDDCPAGSIFWERPPSLWERNRYYLVFGGSLVVLLLLFLFFWQRNRIRVLNALSEERQQKLEANRELVKLFEEMPIGYSKGKLERNQEGAVTDVEVLSMNGRFIPNFIAKGTPVEGRRLSDLFGPDFRVFLQFLQLMDIKRQNITYSQYFSTVEKHLGILITNATQHDCIDVYYIDTTDLHAAEQKLNETNHKLTMALDVASIIPWNWDLVSGDIQCDISQGAVLGQGVMENENQITIPGNRYFANIHKEDRPRIERAYRDLTEGRVDKIREEYRVLNHTTTGRKLDWVEACATVGEQDEQGKPLVLIGSLLVITPRKQMERELIDARDQAQESNRLKSAFLANMSHEIRTPLNAIVGFSEMLGSVEENEEREEYVRIIESNNNLLLQLIGDILDLSKIEAGTLEFIETPVDVTDLVRDSVGSLQMRAESKNLTLTLGECLPECTLLTDRNRMNQVITNFITNAIKFTDEGGITVSFTLQQDNMLRFCVTDTGCGIPVDKQQDIFTRFVKLNSFVQGTGLGLPICQTIVSRMGGEIGVESEPGKGSTFWFTVPYRKVRQNQPVAIDRAVVPVRADKITILIAEDNESNYRLFETILKKDYHILHAWNGQEAVELFAAHRPHIVLMDINMPVMDGYEATTEIRKISADVPILAVTAYAYASDEQRILAHGFDGYTAKPINANALRAKLNELIQSRLLMMF